MSSLSNYIIWKWLLVFGFVFWAALCAVDRLYMSQPDEEIFETAEELRAQFEEAIEMEMKMLQNHPPVEEVKSICGKENHLPTDANDNIEAKKIEHSYILNAVTLLGFLIFVTVARFRNGISSEEEERGKTFFLPPNQSYYL